MFRIHRKLFLALKKMFQWWKPLLLRFPPLHHLVTPPTTTPHPIKKFLIPPSLKAIWKTLYSGVEVVVLALLTSWTVLAQQPRICFCLQMLRDFHLINLMMVEMGFINFPKFNLCQLHSGPWEICHTFGNLFLPVPLSLSPIVVLKNFVEMVLQQWIGSFHYVLEALGFGWSC